MLKKDMPFCLILLLLHILPITPRRIIAVETSERQQENARKKKIK